MRITFLSQVFFFMLVSFYSASAQQTAIGIGSGQETESSFELIRELDLTPDSDITNIKIDVQPDTRKFSILIKSVVYKGGITVEIFDEKNKKQGSFKVGKQLETNQETASGNFNKYIMNPGAGEWTVRITPDKAQGMIYINSNFIQ